MNRNEKLYLLLAVLVLLGYLWLFYSISNHGVSSCDFGIGCPFKLITGIPCPSCGVTRSVILFFNGNLLSAISMNPLGIVVSLLMILLPIGLLFDLIFKKLIVISAYDWIERTLKRVSVAIPLITIIVLNWIWNIYKGV